MSKTWLLGALLPWITQYGPQVIELLSGYLPMLEVLIPHPYGQLATLVATAVLSWLGAILVTLSRNDAVKTGKTANPVTGSKDKEGIWK